MANLENFKSMKKLERAVLVRLPKIIDKLEKTMYNIWFRRSAAKQQEEQYKHWQQSCHFQTRDLQDEIISRAMPFEDQSVYNLAWISTVLYKKLIRDLFCVRKPNKTRNAWCSCRRPCVKSDFSVHNFTRFY